MSLYRQERMQRGRFRSIIEGSSIKDLKVSINPSTKVFVLEQKRTRALRVEGNIFIGKDVITGIMMFRPGIRRGGLIEVVDMQIRGVI